MAGIAVYYTVFASFGSIESLKTLLTSSASIEKLQNDLQSAGYSSALVLTGSTIFAVPTAPPTHSPTVLSPGKVAGVAVGVLFGGILIVGAVVYYMFYSSEKSKNSKIKHSIYDSPSTPRENSPSTPREVDWRSSVGIPGPYEIGPQDRFFDTVPSPMNNYPPIAEPFASDTIFTLEPSYQDSSHVKVLPRSSSMKNVPAVIRKQASTDSLSIPAPRMPVANNTNVSMDNIISKYNSMTTMISESPTPPISEKYGSTENVPPPVEDSSLSNSSQRIRTYTTPNKQLLEKVKPRSKNNSNNNLMNQIINTSSHSASKIILPPLIPPQNRGRSDSGGSSLSSASVMAVTPVLSDGDFIPTSSYDYISNSRDASPIPSNDDDIGRTKELTMKSLPKSPSKEALKITPK